MQQRFQGTRWRPHPNNGQGAHAVCGLDMCLLDIAARWFMTMCPSKPKRAGLGDARNTFAYEV